MQNEASPQKNFAQKQEKIPELTSELNTFAGGMIDSVNKLTDQNKASGLIHIWNTLIRAHNLLTYRYLNNETLRQAVNNVLRYDRRGDDNAQNLFIQKIELTYEGELYVFLHDYAGGKPVVTIDISSRDQYATGQPSDPPALT